MVTIDMRGADTHFWGYGVDFSEELLATATAYVWDASGASDTIVYLYGSGIASSGGAPTAGTIDEIRIDLNGDGFLGGTDVDITITGISLSLVDLAQDDDLFWETVLQGSDTIFPFFNDPTTNISYMFGDGLDYRGSAGSLHSDDLLDATWTLGNLKLWGDYQTLSDAEAIAGDDTLVSAYAPGGISAIGDIGEVRAVSSDVSVTGGDDVIEIASSSDSQIPHIKHLVGDVETVAPSAIAGANILVTGGDDTVTNLGGGLFISLVGDVLEVLAGVGDADVIGGHDTLTGSGASEDIAGDVLDLQDGFVTGGDDFIEAGDGDDDIAGDVLVQTGGSFTGGDDIIDGGPGADTIDGQTGTDTVTFLADPFGVIVVLDNGGADGSAIGQGSDILRDIENVIASITADTVTGNGEANLVLAFDGADSVRGLGGADTLYGWDDNDKLSGGEGADSLYGGYGDDTLVGGRGGDVLDGDDDKDWADYSAAANEVTVDLSLAGAQDTGEGLDELIAIENLIGSGFDDALTGSSDANRIRGLSGLDTLTGGAGADKFDFDAITHSGSTNATADRVEDFEQGSDLIDLRTIDVVSNAAGDQDFTFIGTADFTAEGQVRYRLSGDGSATFVQINTSGEDGIDMTIRLSGAFTLTDQDFNL
jgi:hypothetical protein